VIDDAEKQAKSAPEVGIVEKQTRGRHLHLGVCIAACRLSRLQSRTSSRWRHAREYPENRAGQPTASKLSGTGSWIWQILPYSTTFLTVRLKKRQLLMEISSRHFDVTAYCEFLLLIRLIVINPFPAGLPITAFIIPRKMLAIRARSRCRTALVCQFPTLNVNGVQYLNIMDNNCQNAMNINKNNQGSVHYPSSYLHRRRKRYMRDVACRAYTGES
jgi:hypothetical protein